MAKAPPKLQLASIFGNNSNNNSQSPPVSSPMGEYYEDEARMTSRPLLRPPFSTIRTTTEIITMMNSGTIIGQLGTGARSAAQIIQLGPHKFILRKTLVHDKKVRDDLTNEQFIYSVLESDPTYTNYISNLLYADVPLIHHRSEAYNYAYFVFEWREGNTLDQLIKALPDALPYKTIIMLVSGIANALKFIASKGIVHRDIKPENIFIDASRDNLPLIYDFDASCRNGVDCTAAEFVGTSKYMTNSAKAILRKGLNFSAAQYTYTYYYDLYSVVVMMKEDLIKMTLPEDKPKLLEYAALMDPLKMLGGSRMNNRKTMKRRSRGGSCGASSCALPPMPQSGGGCGCGIVPKIPTAMGGYIAHSANYPPSGGYRATKRNLKYLRKYKRGESIGFTMRSSLKAKGLLPRANGKYRVSEKYKK